MKKKLILFFVAFFLMLTSLTTTAQVRFGAKAGLNMANIEHREDPEIVPNMKPLFQVGGAAEISLPLNTYLGLGLELQSKGYNYDFSQSNYYITAKINPIYLQVPVQLVLRSANGGVFGGIGAYFAYGIAGQTTLRIMESETGTKDKIDHKIEFGNTIQDDFRPFDYGISVAFGYESKNGVRISGEYCKGLGDLRTDYIKETKLVSTINHKVASLCITYFFYKLK